MRKSILFSLLLILPIALCAQIRVVSRASLGYGFEPRFTAQGEVEYLASEADRYPSIASSDLRVDNKDLRLNLYRNGECTVLTPHGENAHYIWSSLSPDGSMILFNSRFGTAVCDLQGQLLYNIGFLDAPVWYGNDYVVGMRDYSEDGHSYSSSSLYILSLDGSVATQLTSSDELAMYPATDALRGRVAYQTLDGELRLLQLNLTEQPISNALPAVREVEKPIRPKRTPSNKQPQDVRIYINPGHGGHGSNDRPMTIYPFASGDPNGFWESNSNLTKGLKLDSILTGLGMQVMMSRRTNNDGGGGDYDILQTWLSQRKITQAEYDYMLANGDDRSLSAIVAEANAYNADYMISIHSNAGGLSNMVLMLYSGKDANDNTIYADEKTPEVQLTAREVSTLFGNYLVENTVTNWSTNTPNVTGDKTFGRTAMGWSNGYGVLRNIKVPGVISEGSMHDYIPETYRLMNDDYRAHESWQFARAFYGYFCGQQMQEGVILGQVRDQFNKMIFPEITARRNTRDELRPILGATVQLMQGGEVLQTYTTDQLYNGVFAFWNVIPGSYTIHVEAPDYYPKDQLVTVSASQMIYPDMMLQMERMQPPHITSYSPVIDNIVDSIEVATKIVMDFDIDMLADSTMAAFSVEPACNGTLAFSNSQRTLTFTPSPSFAPGVEYTITLSTKACHPDTLHPNHLEQPFVLTFRTRNRPHLLVKQTYPEDGATNISLRPEILLLTDLKLDASNKSKAAELFTVRSEDGSESFTANSRILKLNTAVSPFGVARFQVPQNLQPNTRYIVSVAPTLNDTVGVELTYTHQFSFTTGDGNEYEVKGELLQSLEDVFFVYNPDKSEGVNKRSVTTSKTVSCEGTRSNDITYAFAQDAPSHKLFYDLKDVTFDFTSLDTIALSVYGDLSYNEIWLEFSIDGDIQYVQLGTMDYAGWQQLYTPLNALPEAVTYQLTGLLIKRGDNLLSWQGECWMDALRRVKGKMPSDIETINVNAPRKIYRDGEMLIQAEQRTWTVTGAEK